LARDLTGVFELTNVETLPAINAAAVQLLAYFTELAAKRRAVPRDDLLSDLLAVRDADDGRLTDAELLHNLTLLLVAGFETTNNLLGNGLEIILQHSPAGEGVRDGSIPPSAFVEEVLRFDSPVQLTSRLGYDTKVGGVPVSPGTGVVTLLGAGNRDPRRFTEPARFDPMRPDGGPLSFGGGAHFCIGAALARLEGAVAFPPAAQPVPEDRRRGRTDPPGPASLARLRHAPSDGRLAARHAPQCYRALQPGGIDALSMWAGQGVAPQSAADIVTELMQAGMNSLDRG
jgi:cytochrome P450